MDFGRGLAESSERSAAKFAGAADRDAAGSKKIHERLKSGLRHKLSHVPSLAAIDKRGRLSHSAAGCGPASRRWTELPQPCQCGGEIDETLVGRLLPKMAERPVFARPACVPSSGRSWSRTTPSSAPVTTVRPPGQECLEKGDCVRDKLHIASGNITKSAIPSMPRPKRSSGQLRPHERFHTLYIFGIQDGSRAAACPASCAGG